MIADKSYHFYGNIGRCLFLMGDTDKALACLVKSAQLLASEVDRSSRLNSGYARLWIGDLMERAGVLRSAAVCYRASALAWDEVSPSRALEAERSLARIISNDASLGEYVTNAKWKVESEFSRLVSDQV